MGTVSEPVPVNKFAANFSPIPRSAPPPFGNASCGAVNAVDAAGELLFVSDFDI
jgi:hypothetical protein